MVCLAMTPWCGSRAFDEAESLRHFLGCLCRESQKSAVDEEKILLLAMAHDRSHDFSRDLFVRARTCKAGRATRGTTRDDDHYNNTGFREPNRGVAQGRRKGLEGRRGCDGVRHGASKGQIFYPLSLPSKGTFRTHFQ